MATARNFHARPSQHHNTGDCLTSLPFTGESASLAMRTRTRGSACPGSSASYFGWVTSYRIASHRIASHHIAGCKCRVGPSGNEWSGRVQPLGEMGPTPGC